jgi:hypothetical protein
MTPSRWIAVLLALAVGVAVALAAAARLADGPIGPIAGGPFRTGERVAGAAVDWESLADTPTVELQLLDPPRSRTTHIVVLEGQAYVPCGIVKVGPFVLLGQAFWKRWPGQVAIDPRVIVRSAGRLFEARAVRVTDPALHRTLVSAQSAKYQIPFDEPPDPQTAWFFHLAPR